jgi:hypothetical protein
MKKSENKALLLAIIRKNIQGTNNEFKNDCFYLSTENIAVIEVGKILGKEVSEILAFF